MPFDDYRGRKAGPLLRRGSSLGAYGESVVAAIVILFEKNKKKKKTSKQKKEGWFFCLLLVPTGFSI